MTLALYVHWPFCISKCPYCDFNSHVRTEINHDDWQTALLADLDYEAAQPVSSAKLGSIFFGGGTPSLMPPPIVQSILTSAEKIFGFEHDIEITLEANPSSAEASRFADLASIGVNRVSLGIQSLNDQALQFLGRAHNVGEALAALELAQNVFSRVSFDLIYALPNQDEIAWRDELERAVGFETGHLSLYQLTIEPGTKFESMVRRNEFVPLDNDYAAGLYEMTQHITAASNIPAYETSNHARSGEESRHNLTYWRYQDYIGIGPGAHGRRSAIATQRHKKPENYLSAVARNGHGIEIETPLSSASRAMEALLMGLRLHEGVNLAKLSQRTGLPINDMIDEQALQKMCSLGFTVNSGDVLKITEKGRPLLDAILPQIIV